MKIVITALIILTLQSCATLPPEHRHIDCSKTQQELDARYALFTKLPDEEIARRRSIAVPTLSALDQLSVLSKIFAAAKNSEPNAKMIPVDLRYYQDVTLGNIIVTASRDVLLPQILITSKYNQGVFVLINLGNDSITVIPPPESTFFKREKVPHQNLQDAEIVINVSDAGIISSNMKFAPNVKVSIIADRIIKPYRLDLRESSNVQFNLDQKWIMPVYSIEDSYLEGGKDTTGLFEFINNQHTKMIFLQKFFKSVAFCYKDPNGLKLE